MWPSGAVPSAARNGKDAVNLKSAPIAELPTLTKKRNNPLEGRLKLAGLIFSKGLKYLQAECNLILKAQSTSRSP